MYHVCNRGRNGDEVAMPSPGLDDNLLSSSCIVQKSDRLSGQVARVQERIILCQDRQ